MAYITIPLRPKTSVLTQAVTVSLPANSTTAQGRGCSTDNGVYKQSIVLAKLDLDSTNNRFESQLTECANTSDTSGSTTASSSYSASSGPITPLSTSPTSPISCHSLDFEFEQDEESSHYPEESLEDFKAKFYPPRRLQGPPCLTTPRSPAMEASQSDRDPSLSKSHKPVGTGSLTGKPSVSGHKPSSTYTLDGQKSSTDEPCMTPPSKASGSYQDPTQYKFPNIELLSEASGLGHVYDGPNDPENPIDNSVAKGTPVAPRPSAASMVNSASVEVLSSPTTVDIPEFPKCAIAQRTTFHDRDDQQLVKGICELIIAEAFGPDLQRLIDRVEAQASVTRCLEELSSIIGASGLGEFQQPFRETPSEEDKPTSGSDSPSTGGRIFCGSSGRSRKRTNGQDNTEEEDPYSNGRDQGNGEEDSVLRSKKIKTEGTDNRYSCPYRKRNPLRFNIRDYSPCATNSSADLPNLKRHIKQYHKRQANLQYACYRCGVDQGTREQLTCHLQLPPECLCAVRRESLSNDPEDGITPAEEDMLNERKSSTRVNTWRSLCRTLFPEDNRILSSVFEPPVELDEVSREFDLTEDELRNRLRLESKSISELTPEAQDYVASQMEHASWDYIQSVLRQSRLHADHNSGKYRGRKKSQKQSADHTQEQNGFVSPATVLPRQILPKPSSAPGSTGQSLSSSWETDNSDLSSCQLLSGSSYSSLSLTSPWDQQLGICHDGHTQSIALPSHVDTGGGTETLALGDDQSTGMWRGINLDTTGEYQSSSFRPLASWVPDIDTFRQQHQQGGDISNARTSNNAYHGHDTSIQTISLGSHEMDLYPVDFYSIFDAP